MAIDFAGTELEAFIPSGPNAAESTVSGTFDASVVRCAIRVGNGGTNSDYVETPTTTPRTTSWTHWEWRINSTTGITGADMIIIYNSSGTAVFRINFPSTGYTIQAQYWNGSVWTNIGSTVVLTAAARYTFDLKLVCGSSGSFELWSEGTTLLLSGSASMPTVDNAAKRRWTVCTSNSTSGGPVHLSQVIVSDSSTIGHKYYSKPPTGNGANTAWTSDFTAVDETVLSTADFIESTVAGDVETFTGAAISIPTGVVKAVVVSTQSKNAASGPQNVQACLRKGGTNYFSSNISGIGINYSPIQAIFETDPSTSSAWTLSDAGAATLEFGVRSQA